MGDQSDQNGAESGTAVTKSKVGGYNFRADIQNCLNAVKTTIALNRKAITERDGETRIELLAEIASIQSQLISQLYELRKYEE